MKKAIYGAGLFGRALINEFRRRGEDAEFFIDEYAVYREFCGRPVRRIREVEHKDQVQLLNSTAYDLVAGLKQAGFTHVLSLREAIAAYPGALAELNETMWIVKGERLVDEHEIVWLESRLADDKSRQLLRQLVAFRRQPVPEHFFYADGDKDYFPSDFDPYQGIDHLRFADCGAFTGDTVQSLFDRYHRPISWIIALEPDPNNLKKMVARSFSRPCEAHRQTEVFIVPVGAYHAEMICGFQTTDAGTTSAVTAGNTNCGQVSVARLDTILAHTPPNFIKMDIEGAEPEALAGAANLIRTHSPNLAISIYHKPEHLWEIPRYLDSLCPKYKFRMRLHGNWGHELTLYCTVAD